MFRCKECGYEFKIKPEYCDCGNNTFDEISLPPHSRGDNSAHNPTLQTIPDFKQVVSVLIFVLCIILSILPWTIKDKTPKQKPVVQKAQPVTTNIPDIENIWNSTPVKTITPTPIPEPVAINEVIHKKPPKAAPVKTEKPKQIQKPTEKVIQKPVTKTQVQKPAPKKETPKTVTQQKPAVTQQTTTTHMQNAMRQPVPITKPVDKTPLINYKNDLRVALLSKLNIPNIQGTGDCAISFSIDENGKLLNRKFIYKSSNKSVNDEVYLMLMRLPNFKKPPEIYNGEIIKLKFFINNGYYEISFI